MEIDEAEKEIQNVLGENFKTHLFRFPGGSNGGKYKDIKKAATVNMREQKKAYVNWNSLTNDSAGAKTLEEQIAVFEQSRKNKKALIVLMHDSRNKSVTIEATRYIIRTLKQEGYVFKNFYEIFKRNS